MARSKRDATRRTRRRKKRRNKRRKNQWLRGELGKSLLSTAVFGVFTIILGTAAATTPGPRGDEALSWFFVSLGFTIASIGLTIMFWEPPATLAAGKADTTITALVYGLLAAGLIIMIFAFLTFGLGPGGWNAWIGVRGRGFLPVWLILLVLVIGFFGMCVLVGRGIALWVRKRRETREARASQDHDAKTQSSNPDAP